MATRIHERLVRMTSQLTSIFADVTDGELEAFDMLLQLVHFVLALAQLLLQVVDLVMHLLLVVAVVYHAGRLTYQNTIK